MINEFDFLAHLMENSSNANGRKLFAMNTQL